MEKSVGFVSRRDQEHHGNLWCYEVLTPQYESGGDGHLGPPEYGCDYRLVYTRSARRAVVLAVRAWTRFNRDRHGRYPQLKHLKRKYLSLGSEWVETNIMDCRPPWKGVTASRCPTITSTTSNPQCRGSDEDYR